MTLSSPTDADSFSLTSQSGTPYLTLFLCSFVALLDRRNNSGHGLLIATPRTDVDDTTLSDTVILPVLAYRKYDTACGVLQL